MIRAGSGAGRDATWVFAAAAAVLAIYLATLSPIQSWETIAQAARAADDPLLAERYFSTRLLHPNHLLYVPFARGFTLALRGLGVDGDRYLPLQALSATFGALAALLAGLLARRLGASPRRAALVVLASGLSNVAWRLSTEIGAIVPGALLLLLALWVAAGARSARGFAAAGAVLAAAILVHQMVVMAALAASAAWLLAAARGRLSWTRVAAFVATWTVLTGAGYALCGWIAIGATTPRELLDWVLTQRSRIRLGGLGAPAHARLAFQGAAEAWVSLTPWRALRHANLDAGVVAGAVAVPFALGGAAWLVARTLPGLLAAWRRDDPHPIAVAAAAAACVAFAVGYQPDNHVFWVFGPPLVAPLVAALGAPTRVGRTLVPGLIAVAAAVNLFYRVLPSLDAEAAPYRDLVAASRAWFHDGDVLVVDAGSSQVGIGLVVLPAFGRVDLLNAPLPDDAPNQRRYEQAVRASFVRAAARGGSVFALGGSAARVRALVPDAAARAVGTLRGDTLYRMEPAKGVRGSPASDR